MPCGPASSWQDPTLILPSRWLTLSVRLACAAVASHPFFGAEAITVACRSVMRPVASLSTSRAQKLSIARIVQHFSSLDELLKRRAAHALQNLLEHFLDLRDLLSETRKGIPELEELVCPALRHAAIGVSPGICRTVRVQRGEALLLLLLLELGERCRVLLDRALQPLNLRLECANELCPVHSPQRAHVSGSVTSSRYRYEALYAPSSRVLRGADGSFRSSSLSSSSATLASERAFSVSSASRRCRRPVRAAESAGSGCGRQTSGRDPVRHQLVPRVHAVWSIR